MRNVSRYGVMFVVLMMTSGCIVLSDKELNTLEAQERLILVKAKPVFDGQKVDGGFGLHCFLSMSDKNTPELHRQFDKNTGYYVYKSSADRVYINALHCSEYKVLYNKARKYQFSDFYIDTKAQHVNYIGDYEFNWQSERFKFGDLLNSGGAMFQDQGEMLVRLIDNAAAGRSYMQGKSLAVMSQYPFTSSFPADHKQLVKPKSLGAATATPAKEVDMLGDYMPAPNNGSLPAPRR